jgi:hypothetical protein
MSVTLRRASSGRAVVSWVVLRIGVACSMAIAAPQPGSHPSPRVSDGGDVVGVAAVAADQEGSVGVPRPGRDELRLVAAPGRDGLHAGANGGGGPLRRLRVAPALQLELVCGQQDPRAGVVWAGLPERARQSVLVVLARLIGAGAIDEEAL